MNLQCNIDLASAYKSASQVARILSEDWCARELYCPACRSGSISRSPANTQAADFSCPRCEQRFQLKSLRRWGSPKIVDAGYEAMIRAIKADRAPHLLLLQYTGAWHVRNLMLIPRMFVTESVIEKRRPLSKTARRAGWIGCNILLGGIPEDGRIAMISEGRPTPEQRVRKEFERIRGLGKLPPSLRGWTVDVLSFVRRLRKAEFTLSEIYDAEPSLRIVHPNNRNIRPKIRQQLQILRDLGLVEFKGRGRYVLRASAGPN
jgi:type II restriction enzyme